MHVDPFVLLRTLHLLAAAFWLGAGAMLTLVIFPAIRRSGTAGGVFVAQAQRGGLPKFMAAAAGLTILSGIGLYWQWSRLAGGIGAHGTGGILLMLGALAGVLAAIMGGAILAPTAKQIADLAAEGAADAARQSRVDALHRRMASATRVTLLLLVSAFLLMAASRFA